MLGITNINVVLAHPGHGNADISYFHYMLHHVGNLYTLILLIAFILLLLRVGIKR